MHSLSLHNAVAADRIGWPDSVESVNWNSPATAVFTDFLEHKPLVVNHRMPAIDLEGSMRQQHVRLKLVVDDHDSFLGLVSLDDLNSEEIIKRVALGFDRHELQVGDFMRPRHTLRALDHAELEACRIADLLHRLRDVEQQHSLVLDADRRRVRGVISASDIVRKMRLPLDLMEPIGFARIHRHMLIVR